MCNNMSIPFVQAFLDRGLFVFALDNLMPKQEYTDNLR